MNITRRIIIDAPLNAVWKTAAHDFYKNDAWASSVHTSEMDKAKTPLGDSDMAGRVCKTSFGNAYETFEIYNEKEHTFRYVGRLENQPPFLKRAANTWTVDKVSDSKSRLTMSLDLELNLFPGMQRS